jgi:hypothetical protein
LTLAGHQKSILFNTSKGKKTKIHMGSIRQSVQAQPKNIKKIIETPNPNQPIRTNIFPKKNIFSDSKV